MALAFATECDYTMQMATMRSSRLSPSSSIYVGCNLEDVSRCADRYKRWYKLSMSSFLRYMFSFQLSSAALTARAVEARSTTIQWNKKLPCAHLRWIAAFHVCYPVQQLVLEFPFAFHVQVLKFRYHMAPVPDFGYSLAFCRTHVLRLSIS